MIGGRSVVDVDISAHAVAMHISMVLLLKFLSSPLRGAGPMALMLGHEWQHIYSTCSHLMYAALLDLILLCTAHYRLRRDCAS
jgi:hypothetical protein